MTNFRNAVSEAKAVIGGVLNPSKAVITADSTHNRVRIRAHEGSSAYLFPPHQKPGMWTMTHKRKTIAVAPLAEMIPHIKSLGWVIENVPSASTTAQLALSEERAPTRTEGKSPTACDMRAENERLRTENEALRKALVRAIAGV